jgi:hypothetical protein
MRGDASDNDGRQVADLDPYDGYRKYQKCMRYPYKSCGNYEMPVTGVTVIMTVVMTMALMMRTVVQVEIVRSVCMAMMVASMLSVLRVVNVDMRGVVSGVTVPKGGTRLPG